jgi:hypothetical protein
LIAALVLAGAAMAQKSKPQDEVVKLSDTTTSHVAILANPPQATYTEKITKDGHYVVTFDDPNNEFRCYVTANSEKNRWEIGTFTVVCTRPHAVPWEVIGEKTKP